MKKTHLFAILLGALMLAGCGKDRSGTYKGRETVQSPGSSQSNEVTLQVTNTKDDNFSGTYSTTNGTGTLNGKISGDGKLIEQVRLDMPQTATGSTVNGVPTGGCGGQYVGNLNLNDDTISGTLTLNAPAPTPAPAPNNTTGYTNPQQYGTTQTSYCQGSTRTIVDLKK